MFDAPYPASKVTVVIVWKNQVDGHYIMIGTLTLHHLIHMLQCTRANNPCYDILMTRCTTVFIVHKQINMKYLLN